MRYLIDAYNLIGRSKDLCLSVDDKESACVLFVSKLIRVQDSALLVFDGKDPMNTIGRYEGVDPIRSYYTAYGFSADQFIIETVTALSNRPSICVVTSDMEILQQIKSLGGASLTVESFLKMYLNSSQEEKPEPSESDTSYWLSEMNPNDF